MKKIIPAISILIMSQAGFNSSFADNVKFVPDKNVKLDYGDNYILEANYYNKDKITTKTNIHKIKINDKLKDLPDIAGNVYTATPAQLPDLYNDVNDLDWAYKALEELSLKYNILEGYPDGTFKGQNKASRFELAQGLAKLLNYIEAEQIRISAAEQIALNTMKKEFENEIMTLAARIEINEQQISEIKQTHENDVNKLSSSVNKLTKRHYFTPEMRLRFGLGDPDTSADARLRLTSTTFLTDKTFVRLRLDATTPNLINRSEINGDNTDADLTLAFIETGDLTKWIPEKYGNLNLIGGLLGNSRLFHRGYRVSADQRGFSDTIPGVSIYNSENFTFIREPADGRRMSIGGEYTKAFSKYNGLIKIGALRSPGGSINIPGQDIDSTGDESTFYCVTGQMDIPVKKQPVELKLSHYYSFGDNATNFNTWGAGGRLATKFDGFGVVKVATSVFGGTMPPRYIGGRGGKGFIVSAAYNPTIRAFGNLFGDPDKITHSVTNYVPGKTEIGVAFGNFHNREDESLRVFDVFLSRFLSKNIWGVIRFTHANPSIRGLSANNAVELMTVYKF